MADRKLKSIQYQAAMLEQVKMALDAMVNGCPDGCSAGNCCPLIVSLLK